MVKLNPQVFMVNISSKALEYQNEHPNKSTEEIMRHIILSLDSQTNPDMKIFGIAAANEILKMKASFPQLTDKELLQRLTNNLPKIIESAKG
jgi:hypothetical protein